MKNYDFKDLMAFGVFILALLTFIFQFSKSPRHRKTALKLCQVTGRFFRNKSFGNPPTWAVVLCL